MNGDDVRLAASSASRFLRGELDADWSAKVPDLDWKVTDAVTHMIVGTLWYAIDLAAAGAELHTLDPRVIAESDRAGLVVTLEAVAAVTAHVIDGAPRDTRGFHPMGPADASGFAAMACDELLVHTDDAARGLGVTFLPDDALCERVLRRLFPWAPSETDAWDTLRWANGRAPLGNRPRLGPGWTWHSRPLDEWDGTAPPERELRLP